MRIQDVTKRSVFVISVGIAASFVGQFGAVPAFAETSTAVNLRGSNLPGIATTSSLNLRGSQHDNKPVKEKSNKLRLKKKPLVTGSIRRPSIQEEEGPGQLRHGDVFYEDAALSGDLDDGASLPLTDRLTVEAREPGFLHDLSSTFLYLRDNFVPVLLFRGSTNAVEERDVTYTMPETGALRYSIMHSANVYEGLRGGTASVGDTVATALRGSYSTRARLERANVDRAQIHSAMGAFFPRLEGSVTASKSGSLLSSSTTSTGEVTSAGLELSMPLYTSGANTNLLRQARHASRSSEYSYLAEEHRVALEAISAHINLHLNRRLEQILSRNVRDVQQVAHVARKLFEAGDSSRTDIAIAQANLESARAELDSARRTREEVQAEFESVTGKHAPRNLALPRTKDFLPASLEQAVELAIRYNPTLGAGVEAALASKYAAKAERGRFGPQVNLFGSYNRELSNSDRDTLSEDWRVGVRLRVPLFDATRTPSVGAAKHEALEAGYNALDQRLQVERLVEIQWKSYRSAVRRTSIVKRQVNAVSQSVTGARREYEAGFRSVTDVLSEQLQLARAKIAYENVRHEQILLAYQLAFTTATPKLRHVAAVR